ncbi:MAG: AMP-binding protein [Pseudomonadota bacterium]
MLPENIESYAALRASFRWDIPNRFNLAEVCVSRHAQENPNGTALIIDHPKEREATRVSWRQLDLRCKLVAGALQQLGVHRGDRVAIQLPQGWEAVATHLAIYHLGAIAVPLATQFGPQAIAYRIEKARPKIFVATRQAVERWRDGSNGSAAQTTALIVGANACDELNFEDALEAAAPVEDIADTGPDDAAMMLFTSGTTGQPKGVLHAHRVLLGHLPGIQLAQELLPHGGDVFWTPSDWAWAGGLLNALLPALYFGVPVVAANAPRFSSDWALSILSTHKVTNAFLPPTAIRILANHDGEIPQLHLRAVGAAGEQLGPHTHRAARRIFNAPVNEFYGQTECNTVIGSSHSIGVSNPASMGKVTPGHDVRLISADGQFINEGDGQIVINADTPVAMLGYFEDTESTAEKIINGWIHTGDIATLSADGWFTFKSRNDDIITSAGYRIGPFEIEECLRAHSDVLEAAVVGISDEERTEQVAAFVKITPQAQYKTGLDGELKAWVRDRLSAHLYPRHVEIVDHIPTTESGKIIRRAFRKRT